MMGAYIWGDAPEVNLLRWMAAHRYHIPGRDPTATVSIRLDGSLVLSAHGRVLCNKFQAGYPEVYATVMAKIRLEIEP